MVTVVSTLSFLILIGAFFWFSLPLISGLSITLLCLVYCSFYLPLFFSIACWALYIVVLLFLYCKPLRLSIVTKPLLKYVHRILPAMSDTERVALEAGDVWLESNLFKGDMDWNAVHALRKPSLSKEETDFINNECETLCEMIQDWEQVNKQGDLSKEVWVYIKEKGFLGLIIPKEYGGKAFSPYCHSTVVMKIASRSISTAVSIMVPNSLGPAELLLQYGTESQKKQYLPDLAIGKHIPCFALTAPDAGSDASSLTDRGKVLSREGKLYIQLSWSKRYITLAPISTLLGLAFKLEDPDNLLQQNKKEIGITLALIPTSHQGVNVGSRHSPLGLSFMNGTTHGQDVVIPIEYIVGGVKEAGQGWRMLMECLSIGRSISLPALSTAAAKLSFRMTGAYAQLRKQFRVPIGQFEGIEEALGQIAGTTYMMEAVRQMTADAVGQGIKPSLVSAITKYHLTEMAREVVDHAMDVHAGRAIQFGPRNYLGLIYTAIPMIITVEGANILTRNLMIFGQGATRCHPYVREEMELAASKNYLDNIDKFDAVFFKHLRYSLRNFVRTLGTSLTGGRFLSSPTKDNSAFYYRQITRMSIALSFLSDMVMAQLGGSLKRRERLSARLGDVLSYLYIATAVLKYYENHKSEQDEAHLHWSLQTALFRMQEAFLSLFQNLPFRFVARLLKSLVFPFGNIYKPPKDELSHTLSQAMLAPSEFRDRITEYCFVGQDDHDAVGRVERALVMGAKVKPAEDKLAQAIRRKTIPRSTNFHDQINVALEAGVLDKTEAQALSLYESARVDALDVDTFSFEALSGEKINGSDKQKRGVYS